MEMKAPATINTSKNMDMDNTQVMNMKVMESGDGSKGYLPWWIASRTS